MKYNKTLLLAIALLTLIVAVVLLPGTITAQNPYALSLIKFWLGDNGALQIATAPYAPGSDHLLGTDQLGRDLLSFLAYGTRLTLGLALGIMLGRMLLAIPLGIWAGMGNPLASRLIARFNLVLTTIPPLLIAIIILRIDLFTSLYKAQSIGLFIVTLSLLGWSKLAAVVYKSTEQLMAETFMLSETAIGKSKTQLIWQHLLPHLLPELVILSVMEIAAVLTLLMQLGIFSIFIGNLKIIKDSSSGGYSYFNVSFEPEWSSLLGSARDYIRVAPWIALSAGFMFFYTVLSFNLLGEGLRQHYQLIKANPRLRRRPSPVRILSLGLAALLLMALSFWPNTTSYQPYYTAAFFDTADAKNLVNRIEAAFKAEGLESLSSEGFVQSFDSALAFKASQASLRLNESQVPQEAFQILAGTATNVEGRIVDGTTRIYDQSNLSGLWLWVDTTLIGYPQLLNCAEDLKARGAIGLILSEEMTPNGSLALALPIIQLSRSNFDFEDSLSLRLEGTVFSGMGQNLAATIKGSEPTLAHNQVLLLMDYHSLEPKASSAKLAQYFNIIHHLSAERNQLKRSISVVLTDGDAGLHYYALHGLVQNKNVNLVLDLRSLTGSGFDKLAFSDALSPISRYYGYVFAKQFKDAAKSLLANRPAQITAEDKRLFDENGLATLVIKPTAGETPPDVLTQCLLKVIISNGR